jgi:chromosome segregation ATPase
LPACCCRDKTTEEADMEKEVEDLRARLEGLKELTPGETDTISELAGELDEKEKTLYRLQVRWLAARLLSCWSCWLLQQIVCEWCAVVWAGGL